MHILVALRLVPDLTGDTELSADGKDIDREWYVEPGRRQRFLDLMQRNGRVVNFVSQIYRHKTRERIWIRENAHVVRDANGDVLCFEGTVEDITESQQALQDLSDSERRFRALTEKARVLTLVCDAQGRISYASEATRSMLGRTNASMVGSRLTDWVHPDDAAAVHDAALLRLAEVHAAGELADDEQVDALDDLGLEGGRVEEGGDRGHRAQVGPQAEAGADRQQTLLGPHIRRRDVPLRAADGAEEDGRGAAGLLDRLGADRHAIRVDRRAADEVLLEVEDVLVALADRLEDSDALRRYLRSDAVTGQHEDVKGRHRDSDPRVYERAAEPAQTDAGPSVPRPRAAFVCCSFASARSSTTSYSATSRTP